MNLSAQDLNTIHDALLEKRKRLRFDVSQLIFDLPRIAAAEADRQAVIMTSNGALGVALMVDEQDDRLTDLIDRVEVASDIALDL